MLHCFLHVEDLTTQGEDGLEVAVAPLFGGTTGRIALDEEDLGLGRVVFGAVGT